MTDDELREKIAKAIKDNVGLNLRWMEPMGGTPVKVSISPNTAADAILALIRPAIQAARLEALRPRITDDVIADAFADRDEMESDPLRLLDDVCNYAQDMIDDGTAGRRPWSEIDIFVMGRIYKMAQKAHAIVKDLIEKETAP